MRLSETGARFRAFLSLHRRILTVTSFTSVLFAISCLPTPSAKLVVVPALVLASILFAESPDRQSWWIEFRQGRDLQFIAFALFWSIVSDVHLGSALPRSFAQLSNGVLIGCLAVLTRLVCLERLGPRFLRSLVGFTCAGVLASITAHVWEGFGPRQRLDSFALNHSPILAAGAYCCAFFAVLELWRSKGCTARERALLAAAVIVLLTGLGWAQSRGPILALPIALACIPIVGRFHRHGWVVVAACGAAYAITSGTILLENQIHLLICHDDASRLCEPSRRLELWGWAMTSIAQHPLVGVGFGHYFSGDRPHPHNGLLALAFFAGIPFLVSFLALAGDAGRRLASQRREPLVRYAIPALVFGFGFMGTDLANAVGFINTHYLFIWIPISVAYSAWSADIATTKAEEAGLSSVVSEPKAPVSTPRTASPDRPRNDR